MEDKKVCKKIIKRAKKHPDWYTPEEVSYAKLMKKAIKKENRRHKMSNISEATQHDWEDFWYSPEKFGTWYSTDFEKVWKEMDQIEPLTPITQTQRES